MIRVVVVVVSHLLRVIAILIINMSNPNCMPKSLRLLALEPPMVSFLSVSLFDLFENIKQLLMRGMVKVVVDTLSIAQAGKSPKSSGNALHCKGR